MRLLEPQNANSTVISVTNTSTALFDLIDTAGSVTNSEAYFYSPDNEGPADGVIITPEDGSIRLGYDITPTASVATVPPPLSICQNPVVVFSITPCIVDS